ncbi:MAG: hypothetical protein HHAS10_04330 [Candidatus Altimarinota bacterium]
MSGNKIDDILESGDGKENVAAQKLIHFMRKYHPKIQIDRKFQRDLKYQLFSKTKKSPFAWYYKLSYFTVLATSFIVIFSGIGKYFWNQNTYISSTLKNEGINDAGSIAESQIETNTHMSMKSLLMEKSVSNDAIPTSNEQGIPNNTESPSPKIATQTNTKSEDLDLKNLNDEIIDIANNIDSISDAPQENLGISSPEPGIGGVPARMMVSAVSEAQPMRPEVSINYPNQLIIYKKSSAWQDHEIQSRSGSGVVKVLERTITKYDLSSQTLDLVAGTEFIEYKTAKKEGDVNFYLIPSLGYKNNKGDTLFTPIIDGYNLY